MIGDRITSMSETVDANMNFEFIQTGPKVTSEQLDQFEGESHVELPNDYRQFLLTQNGGVVNGNAEFEHNDRVYRVPSFVQLMESTGAGLRRTLWETRQINVGGLLPVASTMNNDSICVGIEGQSGIHLAVWLRENGVATGVKVEFVADSFDDFIKKIVGAPKQTSRIEEIGKFGTKNDLEEYLAGGGDLDACGEQGDTILAKRLSMKISRL